MAHRLLFLVGDDVFFCSHRLPIARAAVAAGYDVTVATHVTTLGDRITAAGCRLVPLRLRRATTNPLREVASVAELVPLYRRLKPDLVHHIALKPVVYGSMAARMAGVKHVVNAIAGMGWVMTSDSAAARALRPLLLFGLRTSLSRSRGRDRVIVQIPEDRALVIENGMARAEDVVLIRGSGVDLTAFAATPLPGAKPPVVMLAARLLWDKGVAEFVEAARQLRNQHVAVRMVIVGAPDPSSRAAVPASELQQWARDGVIEWWGPKGDMPAVLAQSTIVCLPTTYGEGVPKILLEGAAAGRPLVATDWPGCREVVRDGDNGVLVPPRDPAALAAALRALLEDPERCRRMGERSRAIAERDFSVESVVERTLAVYRELLSGG